VESKANPSGKLTPFLAKTPRSVPVGLTFARCSPHSWPHKIAAQVNLHVVRSGAGVGQGRNHTAGRHPHQMTGILIDEVQVTAVARDQPL